MLICNCYITTNDVYFIQQFFGGGANSGSAGDRTAVGGTVMGIFGAVALFLSSIICLIATITAFVGSSGKKGALEYRMGILGYSIAE